MTNEIKQSSIEWLINIVERYIENLSEDDLENLSNLFEQAKEMHKQEIIDAYKFGISDEYVIGSEDYYNKTFGK